MKIGANQFMGIEIWKDVEGHEGKCQVSNLGRIKYLPWTAIHPNGARKYKERITHNKSKSYCVVSILNKPYTVHRIVAKAFIPNPDNKPEVNHIDGNRSNNAASNLEWATRQENINHAIHQLCRKGGGRSNLTPGKVREIRELFSTMRIVDIANKFGVGRVAISRIKSGKTWNDLPEDEKEVTSQS